MRQHTGARAWLGAGMALIVPCLWASTLEATTTRAFRQTTAKDFEEGEAAGTAVLAPGEVVPGMKATRVAVDAAFVWCTAVARDRATAYFGTGDRGRIFAVGETGSPRQVAELDVPWVTALAVHPDGSVLAGSTPGGQVWRVDPKAGKGRVFAKLGAGHVWALVHDAVSSTTFAATGDPGQVFAIDGKGAVRLLWDADDKHVIALAADGPALLAGTADQAILYRVHRDGHAEAVHDFEADEVRAIVRTSGATYLAVNDFDSPTEAALPPPSGAQPAKGTRIVAAPAPASAMVPRTDALKAHGAIYRLDDNGVIEQLLALADGYFTSLTVDRKGNVLATTGSQGKLYRISPDRTVALVADLPERQALALVGVGDGFLIGTGDSGAIYRVRRAGPGEATYLSKVFDAETRARWGHVWWTGSADVALETRSGNTGKPDARWSPFHRVEGAAVSGGERTAEVRNPPGRYLQYRATLSGDSSVLKDVVFYYLPNNQRARVTEVYLEGIPAAVASTTSPAPAVVPTNPRVHSSLLKLRWKVENPDGDELVYKLWFRQDGDQIWRSLGGPDPLAKPEYDWTTDAVSDGRYVIRVWASDEKLTPAGHSLDHAYESSPLLVDNTKPEVLGLAWRGPIITGRARDASSIVTTLEYAIDAGDWRPVLADDGLYDEKDETFTVTLPKNVTPGPHIVNVRAWDAADNVGVARIEITR